MQRVGLMLEMRDLRLELKKESERRENSLEEAMEVTTFLRPKKKYLVCGCISEIFRVGR